MPIVQYFLNKWAEETMTTKQTGFYLRIKEAANLVHLSQKQLDLLHETIKDEIERGDVSPKNALIIATYINTCR